MLNYFMLQFQSVPIFSIFSLLLAISLVFVVFLFLTELIFFRLLQVVTVVDDAYIINIYMPFFIKNKLKLKSKV